MTAVELWKQDELQLSKVLQKHLDENQQKKWKQNCQLLAVEGVSVAPQTLDAWVKAVAKHSK